MAWNQPGKNGQDNNPWGNNNRNNNNETLLQKLIKMLQGTPTSINNNKRINPGLLILVVLVVIVGIWAASGFYTIKEGERGVVTRFGKKLDSLVEPGLNWNPKFIDQIYPVDIATVRELGASGVMLTADENVVRVEMNVQYRVTDPKQYLFSVVNADDSLSQATDSALRAVIGNSTMDKILTEGRTVIRDDTKEELIKTITPYKMGLAIVDVNFQAARPPEEVKESFDDAIAAREDEQRFIREAEAYTNEVLPQASGKAARLLAEANAYKEQVVLEAKGDISRFEQLLPEYKASPKITGERLYIETMERVLSETNKVIMDQKSNNLMMLPLDKILSNTSGSNVGRTPMVSVPTTPPVTSQSSKNSNSIPQPITTNNSIMQERSNNAQRTPR